MFRYTILFCWLIINIISRIQAQGSCHKQQSCSCDFDDGAHTSTTKTEVLAGTVGALSPLLAGGIGLSIYKLIQSKLSAGSGGSTQKPKFERAPSEASDDSYAGHRNKPTRRSSVLPREELNLDRRDSNFTFQSEYSYSRRGSTPASLTLIDQDFDDDIASPPPAYSSPRRNSLMTTGLGSRPRPVGSVRGDELNSWM